MISLDANSVPCTKYYPCDYGKKGVISLTMDNQRFFHIEQDFFNQSLTKHDNNSAD